MTEQIFEPTARVMPSGTVEEFCLKVRKSTPRAVYTFTRGDCEIFAKILVAAFGGEVKYDIVDGHAYALIDEKYYDITGQVEPKNELFDSWRG